MTLEEMKRKRDAATDPRTRALYDGWIAYEEAHPDWRERNWFDRLCDGED